MSTTLDALQTLDVPPLAVVLLTLVTAALVVSDPLLGRRDHRALLAEVAADPAGAETARVRFYRHWVRSGWAYAVAVVALVAVLPGVGLASLGLRLPDLTGLGASVRGGGDASPAVGDGADTLGTIAGMLVGLLLGTLVVVLVLRFVGRRTRRLPLAGSAALSPMLPTTARGRRGWASLSVMAGVTEEVTYRGLVVLTLALLMPGADQRVVVVLAAALFGLAHVYQGWTGVLATGMLGAVLAGLYLSTGSLLVPMVLHVLVDLRALLLVRPERTTPAEASTARAATHVGPAPVAG
jgi:membrane protease YdiL (CAAX protease family)